MASDDDDSENCPICMNPSNAFTTLTCNHKFCYLCIKQTMIQCTPVCPLCRAPIDKSKVDITSAIGDIDLSDVKWLFAGRNGGWWAYESTMDRQIEDAFQAGKPEVKIEILGKKYKIDFTTMQQVGDTVSRQIKRKTAIDVPKGVAGVRQNTSASAAYSAAPLTAISATPLATSLAVFIAKSPAFNHTTGSRRAYASSSAASSAASTSASSAAFTVASSAVPIAASTAPSSAASSAVGQQSHIDPPRRTTRVRRPPLRYAVSGSSDPQSPDSSDDDT